ncbi:hypothetical protein ACS0TY_000624 [Phlomoides rotata]
MMEFDGRTPRRNENKPLEASTSLDQQKKSAGSGVGTSQFVNHAAIAWEESRRKWIGDVSHRSHTTQMEPIISWSTTYEDLLSTNDPFTKPIPLTEMVDFLVDIWHDEGLFD